MSGSAPPKIAAGVKRRRLRLLPLTLFAASLLLTVKVGTLLTPGSPLRDAVSVAASRAQQTQAQPPAQGAGAPAKPTPLTPPATGTAQPTAGAQAPQPAPTPPGAAPPKTPPAAAAAPTPPAAPARPATAPVAGKPATPPAAPSATGPAVATPPADASAAKGRDQPIDPVGMSQSEIDILQALGERRKQLDERERTVEQREALLRVAEQRINDKVNELKTLQARLESLVKKQENDREEQLRRLVKVYENMRPKDAARIFEQLDDSVLIDVAERMKEVKLAPVLAGMEPKRATAVTTELAKRRESKRSSGALPGG